MKLNERKLTKAEVSKREDIIMDMKKNKRELTKRYGKDAEKVMYGRATNLAKKQLENMDPKSKLREMVKNALSSPKLTNEKFSKKYDDDPALKGRQKNLPDALQKSIIDEIEVDDSYSERETMGMEYNQNPEKFLDSIVSILNRFSNGGKFNSSNVNDNYLNTFELEGSPLKVGLNKEFSFDLLSGGKILMSNENLDTILLASEKHSSVKEDKTPTPQKGWYSPISLVSKRRAQADIKQFMKGKRADGMGDYDAIILGVEKNGNQTQLKTLDDFNSKYVEYYLADYNYKTNSYKIPKYQNVKEASENQSGEGFRVEYKTQDGENAKSRIYKTKEEAEKKEAELVNKSKIKQAKIVSVDSGLKEDLDLGHQDDEPHMLKANLYRIGKYAMELYQMMDKFEGQGEVDLPHWWQSKIIKSESMITSAKHYLDFELKEPEIDAMVDVASEEGAISENKFYVTRNLGRGQGIGLVKKFDDKTLQTLDEPRTFDSYEEAEAFVKRRSSGGASPGQISAFWVSDENMNRIDEIDNNDPILMKMRAAKDKKKTVQKHPKGKNNDTQISSLERKRNQLMRDMEQEAEPEGGPISDRYGRELNKIDAKISKLRGKPLTYDQAISEEKSQIPSQEEVDRFFEETQNEMHYLASKPVRGQEKTFNNVEVEAWDEYDLSNWNALVRKKKEGRSPFGESKYSQLAEKIAKNLKEGRFQRVKKDIYDRFLDNPENPRGRAKIIIDKFIKEYGVDASQMAVDVFSNRNNLKPEEKYILKYITKDDVQISSQPGGPDFSALKEDVEEWPKEYPSRYNEYRFELEKVSPTYKGQPGRAKYKLIDIESGELKSTPVFGKIKHLTSYADDLIKPQGGTQSSNFGEALTKKSK